MPRKKKGADGYYRATFTVDGKQYSVRSKDPKQLSSKMAEKIKALSTGRKLFSESTTVQQWGADWLSTYSTGLSPGARSRFRTLLNKYIYPEIGYMRLNSVRPVHCQRILNSMEGMSKDSVKKTRSLLFRLFDAAQDNHLCTANPASKLVLPRTAVAGTHRSITARERYILLETAKSHPAGAWVLLLLYTGLRPAESVVLTGSDITKDGIRVNKALDRYTRKPKEPKSAAGCRTVPIIAPLREVLPKAAPGELLFKNRLNHQLDHKGIARMWKSFLEAMAEVEAELVVAGKLPALAEALPPLVPYDLRHTYCTDLERAGVPLNVASQLMGHASIQITACIYTHTSDDVFADAASKLDALARRTGDIAGDVTTTRENPRKPAIQAESRVTG